MSQYGDPKSQELARQRGCLQSAKGKACDGGGDKTSLQACSPRKRRSFYSRIDHESLLVTGLTTSNGGSWRDRVVAGQRLAKAASSAMSQKRPSSQDRCKPPNGLDSNDHERFERTRTWLQSVSITDRVPRTAAVLDQPTQQIHDPCAGLGHGCPFIATHPSYRRGMHQTASVGSTTVGALPADRLLEDEFRTVCLNTSCCPTCLDPFHFEQQASWLQLDA